MTATHRFPRDVRRGLARMEGERPKQFRYRCCLCGAPALWMLCAAHSWLAEDEVSTARDRSNLDGSSAVTGTGGDCT